MHTDKMVAMGLRPHWFGGRVVRGGRRGKLRGQSKKNSLFSFFVGFHFSQVAHTCVSDSTRLRSFHLFSVRFFLFWWTTKSTRRNAAMNYYYWNILMKRQTKRSGRISHRILSTSIFGPQHIWAFVLIQWLCVSFLFILLSALCYSRLLPM